MFEDSLIESAGTLKSTRQKYTTLASFLIETAVIASVVLVSFLYTEALPLAQLRRSIEAPPAAAPARPPTQVMKVVSVETEILDGRLLEPRSIPSEIKAFTEQEAAPPPGFLGVPTGEVEGAVFDPVISSIASVPVVSIPRAVVPEQKVRVSAGVAEGLLQHMVKPVYPRMAQQAGVQGPVVLHAVIGKDGSVQNLRVTSGHPMLVRAAIDAVEHWRYTPYLLNGEPVEVETQITVNFTLARG